MAAPAPYVKCTIIDSPGSTVVSGGHGCTVVINDDGTKPHPQQPAMVYNNTGVPVKVNIKGSPGATVVSAGNLSNLVLTFNSQPPLPTCPDCQKQYQCPGITHQLYLCEARIIQCPDCGVSGPCKSMTEHVCVFK